MIVSIANMAETTKKKNVVRGLLCVAVCLMAVSELSARKISSVRFDKLEKFSTGFYSNVYHMERDLYRDDGSLLICEPYSIKTTDGKTTELIAGSTSSAYREGKGSYARFLHMYGFRQVNSSSVVVVDHSAHCVRMLDRDTETTSRIAGVCTSAGYVNGKSGKFNAPWGVEVSPDDPNRILVTDYNNNVLRSVDIPTGVISTPLSGLARPRGLAWNMEKTSLFITNAHYISQVRFDVKGSVISNINIVGSTSAGFADGQFASARFHYPQDIAPLSKNLEIVADPYNAKVRVIDTINNGTVPVCYSHDATCNYLSTSQTSILAVDQVVYIGQGSIIYRLTGYKCWTENITAYIPAYEDTVGVQISGDDSGVFPVGEYEFQAPFEGDMCHYFINVKASPVVRTLSFQSKYNVKCASVDNHISKAFLMAVLAHRSDQFLKVCGTYCKMSDRIKPFYTCQGDVMTVTWPTNQVYPYDITSAPEGFSYKLRKNLMTSSLVDAELVILSHNPPLVMPKQNAEGESVDVVIYSSCLERSQTYQKSGDKCA